jgi:hypothetical protein
VVAEVSSFASRLGPVFVIPNDRPAGVTEVPVLDKEMELLIADGPAGVALVPPFASEKVLLIADGPTAVAEAPLLPAFDNENEWVMAV